MEGLKGITEDVEVIGKLVKIVGFTIIILLLVWYMLREGGPSINITHRDQKGVLSQWLDQPVVVAPASVPVQDAKKEGYRVWAKSVQYN